MKTILFKGIVLAAIIVTLGSCTKKPVTVTHSFTATLGNSNEEYNNCWSSVGSNGFSINGQNLAYTIEINGSVPLTTGTYKLSGGTTAGVTVVVQGLGQYNGGVWVTDSTNPGTLTITNYNTTTKEISGTFNFTAYLSQGTESNPVLNYTNGALNEVAF